MLRDYTTEVMKNHSVFCCGPGSNSIQGSIAADKIYQNFFSSTRFLFLVFDLFPKFSGKWRDMPQRPSKTERKEDH